MATERLFLIYIDLGLVHSTVQQSSEESARTKPNKFKVVSHRDVVPGQILSFMDGPSNLKRPRPDETRDEDLYFEDGSVILSAKDADGALVYFRIHKSVLERQSSVFKDMFSVPSPAETDLYDGLPLVHVHDDSKELKEFLQVMYDPGWVAFDPANCCSN